MAVMVAVTVVAVAVAEEEDSAVRGGITAWTTTPTMNDAASTAARRGASEPTAPTGNEPFGYMVHTRARQRKDRIPTMRQS